MMSDPDSKALSPGGAKTDGAASAASMPAETAPSAATPDVKDPGAAEPAESVAPETATSPPVGQPTRMAILKRGGAQGAALAGRYRRPAIAAGLLVGAVGLGMGADRLALRSMGASASRLDTALIEIRQSQEEVGRLRGELHGLRTAMDGSKAARVDLAAKQAQLTERVERTGQDATARLGKLADQLDRMEKTGRDPARVASLSERLDRIEKGVGQVSAQPAPSAPVAITTAAAAPPARPKRAATDVTTTGSVPDAKLADAKLADTKPADPRKTPLDGYVLRGLDGGMALIEARNGRLFEVSPGMTLPGIGRVEAIERRGRRWVVVTPKGFIADR